MAGNIIEDEGVKSMSEMLKKNTTLISLNLRCEKKKTWGGRGSQKYKR